MFFMAYNHSLVRAGAQYLNVPVSFILARGLMRAFANSIWPAGIYEDPSYVVMYFTASLFTWPIFLLSFPFPSYGV